MHMDNHTPQLEERKQPGVEREYRTGEIVVYWEPNLCIHTARCLQFLPQVFDVHRRPWVKVDVASAAEIAETVMRCPTAALRYERLDGGLQEEPPKKTQIEATQNGPLYVRGNLEILNQDGSIRQLPRAALCRCGHSSNKPFCDNSHRVVGFRTTE
jgi:uncharacterized Fe-S cluster protein YjdI